MQLAQQKFHKRTKRKLRPNQVCVICGDEATGYHYEVPSCNGCGSFFRRTIASKKVYQCRKDGDCMLDKNLRVSCRACRFKLCLERGMNSRYSSFELDFEHGLGLRETSPTSTSHDSPVPVASPTKIEEECASILSKLLLLEDSLDFLRNSTVQCPIILLDVLTRPCALQAEAVPSRHGIKDLEVEIYTILEYSKAFSWFRNFNFSDKTSHLCKRTPAILALRLAFHLAQLPKWQRIGLPLESIVESVELLQIDRAAMCLMSAVLLTQTNDLLMTEEARRELVLENTSYSYCLSVYLFKKYGSSGADQIAQHYLLLGTCVQLGLNLRRFLQETQSVDSLSQQILAFSAEEKCIIN